MVYIFYTHYRVIFKDFMIRVWLELVEFRFVANIWNEKTWIILLKFKKAPLNILIYIGCNSIYAYSWIIMVHSCLKTWRDNLWFSVSCQNSHRVDLNGHMMNTLIFSLLACLVQFSISYLGLKKKVTFPCEVPNKKTLFIRQLVSFFRVGD